MRWSLGVLLALLCLATACGSGTQQSPIRVTLTAQDHHPRASVSPTVQWRYCVKVTTAGGKSVASTIDLQVLSGRTPLEGVGLVSLKKSYDHWCGSIGGEASVLNALPRAKKLDFQAVVRAKGVTVKRNWPIVVQPPVLSAHGIGGERFGAPKRLVVRVLTSLLGQPSRWFVSDGCGPRYTEVAWGHLYVEFRQNTFSGYRYLSGRWLRSGVYPSSLASTVRPLLSTAAGITIGDTLGQLRHTYGAMRHVGTDRWQNSSGLVFYDNAQSYPEPPSSRVTEIKYGTCGDF